MDEEVYYDDDLWFTHKGCEGNHYLIGNPHTHPGRMWAWCPKKQGTIFVSKAEMDEISDKAKTWIHGFLMGNQPAPPTGKDGFTDFRSQEYKTWTKAAELFTQTGSWSTEERFCNDCGDKLLASEDTEFCVSCRVKKKLQ